ncbi:MAG: TIGR00725 family protein [Spirochaetaceae bacterium]|nr:MAG: TIGR00725 family protein [Spirochaetaceae bacterium]
MGGVYVGVIGGRRCNEEIAGLAFEVGRRIAEQGWTLVCGGMGGVMEQACRGARSKNGVTLGILPGGSREAGNPYLSYSVVTGFGEARNVLVVKSSQAIIAVAGSYGTLSEIALANAAGIPVVGLRSWRLDPDKNRGQSLFIKEADSPAEAIQLVKSFLTGST